MNTDTWKWFSYGEIFDIHTFKGTNILNSNEGEVPFVSASSTNNGIVTYVNNEAKESRNKITVARNGSVCSAFYQSKDFCASPDDIRIFELKGKELNKYIAIFLCTLIEKEKYRYAYGRKFGTKRMLQQTIKLPVDNNNNPDWEWIENYMKNHLSSKLPHKTKIVWDNLYKTSPLSSNSHKLNTKYWKWFSYDEIFDIRKGFYNKKPEESTDGYIPFIGATDSNNGITSMHSLEAIEEATKTGDEDNSPLSEKLFDPNCITVSNNGSVGYAFYQSTVFTCTHDVNPLYIKEKWKIEMNIYIAMFLCTLIEKEQFRWDYGRKWRPQRMPCSRIKLPIDKNGNPDWQFMEDYIKSLKFSNNLK